VSRLTGWILTALLLAGCAARDAPATPPEDMAPEPAAATAPPAEAATAEAPDQEPEDNSRWSRDAPVMPIKTNEIVILLPNADGTVGRLDLETDDGKATLDQANQGLQFDRLDEPFDADEALLGELLEDMGDEPAPPQTWTVYFELRTTRLTAESQNLLPEIAGAIQARNLPEVRLEGHTDTIGQPDTNIRISGQRANLVRDQLIAAGIPTESIEVQAFGEAQPAIATADGVREVRNRRVEIRVR